MIENLVKTIDLLMPAAEPEAGDEHVAEMLNSFGLTDSMRNLKQLKALTGKTLYDHLLESMKKISKEDVFANKYLRKYSKEYREIESTDLAQLAKPTLVDLFCGSGGLSLGLAQSGFRVIFANDIEKAALQTYSFNHPEIPGDQITMGGIENISSHINDYVNEEVDMVAGGPPCQGFSEANRQRLIDDPRNKLYKYYVESVTALQPKVFVMENVKGMLKVAGQVLETKWSANQDFKDVDSPVIAGYTASLLKASDKNISHDDLNIFVSVVYKADKQKATVSYIDDTTGKTIETKSLTGVSNEHSGYSTISTIKDLENRGYKLVSDDTTGSEIVFDTDDAKDQAYSVHLVHGVTTVTPESPKNPVNGSDMTDRLTKKVHQTIKYVTEAGKRLATSNVQTLTFNRNATVDLVTGAVTSYGDWSDKKETKAVNSPIVKGYTADTKTVEAHSYTAEDFDKTFTVTYKAVKKAVNLPEVQPGKKEVPSPAKKTVKKVVPAPAKAPAADVETPTKAADKQTQTALPQTGESNDKAALAGLGLASILSGIGILGASKRKKKGN